VLLCACLAPLAAAAQDTRPGSDPAAPPFKVVVGAAELVAIPRIGAVLAARIDTGATTTSIHAPRVEEFERDGARWVRFVIRNSGSGHEYPLELPVSRVAVVKSRGRDAATRRPAVALDLVMGSITRRVDVNLADRSGFEFPLLIGRDFLRGVAVVDVALEYTQQASGAPAPESERPRQAP